MREALTKRAIIAGRRQRGKDGSVDQPAPLLVGPKRGLEHREHLRTDWNVSAVAAVQPRELALLDESCEARLFVTHPLLAALERRLPRPEGQQLAGRAQGAEASGRELTRHSSYSGPWHRSE